MGVDAGLIRDLVVANEKTIRAAQIKENETRWTVVNDSL
ncbi:MAG: hypothetical protein BWY65_01266 [Firmicutes bacterium ADurb.Bin373]|nr:MAG: hypothetical protein BWY65_01266 [Firmicutes bacterium ADurb.Bin373]